MAVNIEETTIIRGLGLQRLRTGYFRVEGPTTVGLIVHPNAAAATWHWNGQRYNERIFRQKSLAGRFWFLCSWCYRRVLNLYVFQDRFACRRCLNIFYPSAKQSSHTREPKRLKAWLKWFDRQVHRYEKKGPKRQSC